MKPYSFALILVRFLALGFTIYFSTVLASTYITLTNSSVKEEPSAMSIIQSMTTIYWSMLAGSVVLFLIAPLLAKLLSMGTDRE